MEYCGKLSDNGRLKKALVKMLGLVISVVFVFGYAYDLPALDYGNVSKKSDAYCVNRLGRGYQPEGKKFDGIKAERVLREGGAGIRLAKKNVEELARKFKTAAGASELELLSSDRDADWEDKLFVWNDSTLENTAADWGPEQNPMELPGLTRPSGHPGGQPPTGNIIPNPPANSPLPDVSGEEAVPNPPIEEIVITPPSEESTAVPPLENTGSDTPKTEVPDLPGDAIAPDTPNDDGNTGIPGCDEGADTPSGGEGADVVLISGIQINADGMIYDVVYEEGLVNADGCLKLPAEGCSGILKGAFDGLEAGICEIEIPSNITYIESGALADLPELSWINTEEGNPGYVSIEGVLFDSARSTVVAFPPGRTGTYNVPEYAGGFADYAFANANIGKLDMRDCGLVSVGCSVFGERGGDGLVISAPKEYFQEYQYIFEGSGVIVE